jgi:hypothetical protein
MKRRTFLEVALVLGAGLTAGGQAGLRWSEREGFPGMRVRLSHGDEASYGSAGGRLIIVDRCDGVLRVLHDQPLAEVGAPWRIPALRQGLPAPSKAEGADAVHELEARVVDARGRVLAVTEAPLIVRFRAFGFSA